MSKRKMTCSKRNPFMAGIALLSVLLLVSCTREDALSGDDGGNLPALGLNALQAKDLSEVPTRAAATTAYPTDKFIGFFVKENTANGYTACNNRKGEYNTTRKLWLPTPDSIWLNNHDADIAVYAPYDAAQTTAATLNLAASLRPADGSKDLWCKKFTANNKSTNLAPILEHVYSRFIINLSLDADYKGTAPVDSVSLVNDSLYAAGVFRPFETATYKYEGDAGVGFEISPVKNLTTAAPTASIDLLLIPATLTEDVKLSVTVNGITFGATLVPSRFSGKLEAGKQYNANVKLKPTELEVTSVTINDWNDVTMSEEYEPEFIPEPEPIDIGLPFVFAWGNLRAIKQADNTYKYDFAEEQGYYSKEDSYFCWNTLDPATTTGNAGAWSDALDPCRQVGGGEWYTPTAAQWEAVTGGVHTVLDHTGSYYMKDGSSASGIYYGTTMDAPMESQDMYLFLPASGWRNDSGNWEWLDAYGYYLSSTLDGAGIPQACKVDLPAGSLTGVASANRNYGYSVRCVKDKPKGSIDIGLDFVFAPGNVIATADGNGGYTYDFAEEQGYYCENAPGGDFFCWNTLDPSAIGVYQDSWDDSRDVCRKIGDGQWRTPAKAEWQAMVDAGWVSVWEDNQYTMKNGKKVNGAYFGLGITTPPSEADQDKYVFLPNTGYVWSDTSNGTESHIDSSYTEGYYWSSSSDPNDANDQVDDFYMNLTIPHASISTAYRTDKNLVRCIRNK